MIDQRRIVQIAAGKYHVLALDAAGRIYAWGANTHGQLGLKQRKRNDNRGGGQLKTPGMKTKMNEAVSEPVNEVKTPRQLTEINAVFSKIFAFKNSSYAVQKDGQVYGWGENNGNKFMINYAKAKNVEVGKPYQASTKFEPDDAEELKELAKIPTRIY